MFRHLDRVLEHSFSSDSDGFERGISAFQSAIPKSWMKVDDRDFIKELEDLQKERENAKSFFDHDFKRLNLLIEVLDEKGILLEEIEDEEW
jgi:hypothetical protein